MKSQGTSCWLYTLNSSTAHHRVFQWKLNCLYNFHMVSTVNIHLRQHSLCLWITGPYSQYAQLRSRVLKREHIHRPLNRCNNIKSVCAVCPTSREMKDSWECANAPHFFSLSALPTPVGLLKWLMKPAVCILAFVWGSADQPFRMTSTDDNSHSN